ncbi:Alpha/Beta hydrolase protein [Hypoxylon trugodes]|uniref:Alpha/Beta hydrolase protein n=1 Tax=Hypoxylon trugodes TaxID=326681 RepID=UPI00219207FC|nr:Alpha/Beta hydrolase protein [Hypoxylon trugodes]KAI1383533.1 Alpha/Beta hydrolase protein [Hypoxylon trugodes]
MSAQEKPTVLFIHGAWHLPIHYRALLDELRSLGYPILAPYLVTTGYDDTIDDKTHVEATSQVRDFLTPYLDQGRKVVVVAHSFGGIIASQASVGLTLEDRAARGLQGGIASVVFVAALTEAKHGRPDQVVPFPPGWTDFKKRPVPDELARVLFYGGIDEQRIQDALKALVWQSENTYGPAGLNTPAEVKAPKTYVVCKKDGIVKPESQYERAKAAGAEVVELDCCHSPFLLDQERSVLVDVINKAARV